MKHGNLCLVPFHPKYRGTTGTGQSGGNSLIGFMPNIQVFSIRYIHSGLTKFPGLRIFIFHRGWKVYGGRHGQYQEGGKQNEAFTWQLEASFQANADSTKTAASGKKPACGTTNGVALPKFCITSTAAS